MIPNIGDYVRVFLKKSLQIEGFVHSWGKKIVLSNEDRKTFMVIKKTKQIIMYKIIPFSSLSQSHVDEVKENFKSVEDNTSNYDQSFLFEDSQSRFDNADKYDSISDQEIAESVEQDSRIKKMADLYLLRKEEERKSIAQKLNHNQISNPAKVKYESPGFFKK